MGKNKNEFAEITKKVHQLTKEMKEKNLDLNYKKTYSENFKILKEELKNKKAIDKKEIIKEEKEVIKADKKKRKSHFRYGIKIVIDDKEMNFENINICWEYLVKEEIKADIRKWLKAGIPKKHQARISLFEKININ